MSDTPRSVPATASIAAGAGGDKLHAPAAARNAGPLGDLLRAHAPAEGHALELASGTGEHVIAFARALPGLHWQPTDLDPARLRSIDAHAAEAGLPNIAPARALNATQSGWAGDHPDRDLVLLVNLLHLIPETEARTLLTEAARALAPGGTLIVYGPFLRDGALTSEGDRAFHASLRAHDPAIGYKEAASVADWMAMAGLTRPARVEMPANNLALIARRH